MKSAAGFIDRIKSDEALLLKLANLIEKGNTQSINELMRENGVSEEGIASLIHLDRADVITTSDELSDEDLAQVAGGSWCNGIKNIIDLF